MYNKYQYLRIEINRKIAKIFLRSDTDNTFEVPMMKELIDLHEKLESDNSISAVILTSDRESYFSNGLNLNCLLNADVNERTNIFSFFYEMCSTIYRFKKAHISLISGHAMAGGAVLAALSDFRFMCMGPYRVSFTEVRLGITMPPVFIKILENIIGPGKLPTTILQAKAFKPPEVLELGFVSDILDQADALKKTEKFVINHLPVSSQSFTSIKHNLRKSIIDQFANQKATTIEQMTPFFNQNFTEGLQAIKEKKRQKFE